VKITLTTTEPTYTVKVRDGYRAPAPPPIRPQIEMTVRDARDEYLDVDASDLTVLEDGVEQKIEGFEEALAPVSVMLVLDASGSMKKAADDVKAAARTFINSLPKDDSLGLIQFADTSNLVMDLTKGRLLTLNAVDRYEANGGTALYDALVDALVRLKTVDGRRAVVVLTDGRDENNPGTAPGSAHIFADVVAAAKDADATIFGIGLGPNVDHAPLDTLTQVSGGEAYYPIDVSTLDANYKRVLENLRRRYVISYTSTNATHDGKWRKVEIKSKQTGITIESKGGYFAPNK
jgi:Ca-activated chloride channel homolog